ncbi:outer membrane channel protein TolC [Thalassotalea sp. 1_MG-2023]|uniref:outer membrane channel protein TolC n=1 Tax=Thalassotalea sp. 1_MG-2023 TaxID=3062680 RepID=UPI0026E3D44B|nr:outer membrane channel protein TolC [Thalassotalea sp. 1_MG-2023]MDO6428061.1 outer membrane channel protein TolC [Thalassotalea sp. 1_MG-2023]
MKKSVTSIIIGIVCATSSAFTYAQDLLSTYELAKANDPVVLKAQAQFNASQEGIVQARSLLLPQLSANASITASERDSQNYNSDLGGFGSNITTKTDSTSFGANLNMQLYHHDTWLRLDNAKKIAHRSDISYQVAKQDLIIRVTEAYFGVLSAKDDLEFAKAEKKAIERQLEQTKQRHAVGLTAVTAVHEAQAQFDNAVTAEIRAENNVFNAEEALRVITNVYPRDINILNTERFSASRPSPDSANEWQQTAEAKNLDLIIEKISVDIAKESINIARAGHYPTLDLNGSYGQDKSQSDFTTGGVTQSFPESPYNDSQSIGITLRVPIYSGGATTSAVRQAQANYVAASQDLQQAHRNVVRNARNSYNTVIANVSSIKALQQSVISAESALKATEAGFEVGTRTIVDVLDSTRNLYNAKRNLSSTRYNYIQAILNLKRAGGTISEKDITAINQGLKTAS